MTEARTFSPTSQPSARAAVEWSPMRYDPAGATRSTWLIVDRTALSQRRDVRAGRLASAEAFSPRCCLAASSLELRQPGSYGAQQVLRGIPGTGLLRPPVQFAFIVDNAERTGDQRPLGQ